jgi:hypothetical protein
MAASKHFRLTSFVDPESRLLLPLCETMDQFHPLVRVIERKSSKTREAVIRKELNTNFIIGQKLPLWKIALVCSPKLCKEYQQQASSHPESTMDASPSKNTPTPSTTQTTTTTFANDDIQPDPSQESNHKTLETKSEDQQETLDVLLFFHHCLGNFSTFFSSFISRRWIVHVGFYSNLYKISYS